MFICRGYILFSITFLILFVTTSISGQSPDIRFVNIQKNIGLSGGAIESIVKDDFGFIWLATNNGLCRFDANNNIKTYFKDKKDPNKLQSNHINTLLNDSKGNLWIGTRLGGITRYHYSTETWRTFRQDPTNPNSISNDEILCIEEDSKGKIWIGTEDGLNIYDSITEKFTNLTFDKSNPQALQGKAILSIKEDHRGYIWIGTWGGGLHLLLPDEHFL